MGDLQERITVILRAVNKNFNETLASARKELKGLRDVATAPMERFKQMTTTAGKMRKNYAGANTVLGRFWHRLRYLTHGMRGFRMEMLGVMFFGLMLKNFFTSLLKPVMDAYGVFDLLNATLLLMFLPIMELLFPVIEKFLSAMMGLPEPLKLAIGILVILGVVLGGLLFLIGSFALGIGSLTMAIPTLTSGGFGGLAKVLGVLMSPLKSIGALFSWLGAAGLALAAVIIAVAIGMWVAWQENFGQMRTWTATVWESIKSIFGGAIEIIKAIFGAFFALITGNWTGFWNNIVNIFKGIWDIIKGIFWLIVSGIIAVGLGVFRVALGIYTVIYQTFQKVFSFLESWFGDVWKNIKDWAVKMIENMAAGISSMAQKIKDAILGLFPSWARDAIWKIGKFTISIFTRHVGDDSSDSGSNSSGSSGGKKNDFIWRPGEGATSFSSQDTIIGVKGDAEKALIGGGGKGVSVVISPTYNINVSDRRELEKLLNDNNRRLAEEIKRTVKA